MSVAAFTPVVGDAQMPVGKNVHPLDPLSVEEIQKACSLVKTIKGLGPECRFAMIHLQEPAKADVLPVSCRRCDRTVGVRDDVQRLEW